jgi:hypothetical protein
VVEARSQSVGLTATAGALPPAMKSLKLTFEDSEMLAFDQVERLVDLDAPGAGLLLGQTARRELVRLAAKPGDEVSTVTLFPNHGHRRVPPYGTNAKVPGWRKTGRKAHVKITRTYGIVRRKSFCCNAEERT